MKKFLITISSVLISLLLCFIIIFWYISQKINHRFLYFPQVILKSIVSSPSKEKLNLIILGVDRRNDWLEKTETTDTIMFSQITFSQNKIHLFSLPRDLWDYFTNTKINQIYPLSLTKDNNQDKFNYIAQNFASISGQHIDHTLILSTENLKQLADILGGVDLYLKTAFKDEKYPNEAYINNPQSGAPIYKTIEFKSGWIHLDSGNITEFVRSRKSSESFATGGTDLGRIERQQQLINALIDKVKISLTKNPKIIFDLYLFWENLEQDFNDSEIISYALKYGIKLKNIQVIRHPISAGEDSQNDLLYHPEKFINSQWVFIPHDNNYQQLQSYISQSLDSP